MMTPRHIGVAVATLGLLALPHLALAGDAGRPTVIELFQSQGCNSCPPAEANVAAISDRADVLALAFEVDYWDRLGWKDRFSSAALTERQRKKDGHQPRYRHPPQRGHTLKFAHRSPRIGAGVTLPCRTRYSRSMGPNHVERR